MAFIRLRRSERIKVEFYFAALLAIIAFAFSPSWWIEAVLALLLSAIVVHLILSAQSFSALSRGAKGVLVMGAVALLFVLTWLHTRPVIRIQGPQVADTSPKPSRMLESSRTAFGTASKNEQLARDTASLVQDLRDFQRKVDGWNVNAANELKLEQKTRESGQEPPQAHIERAKELSGSMSKLNQEFNTDLKPRVLAIRKQLMERVLPQSVKPRPTVDWTLQYGFTTYPNAVADVADELQDLASKLPKS